MGDLGDRKAKWKKTATKELLWVLITYTITVNGKNLSALLRRRIQQCLVLLWVLMPPAHQDQPGVFLCKRLGRWNDGEANSLVNPRARGRDPEWGSCIFHQLTACLRFGCKQTNQWTSRLGTRWPLIAMKQPWAHLPSRAFLKAVQHSNMELQGACPPQAWTTASLQMANATFFNLLSGLSVVLAYYAAGLGRLDG